MPSTPVPDLPAARSLADRLGLRAEARSLAAVAEAVARLSAERHLSGAEVYARCRTEPLDSGLVAQVAEHLSISESSFFRHQAHFEAIERTVIPAVRRARPDGGMRVLSAGCAKGEELYSLAIACERAWPGGRHRVVGVDLCEASLKAARAGRYRPWSLRGLDPTSLVPWLSPSGVDTWDVSPALRARVELLYGNLLAPPAALIQRAPFDLIFCRNVLIYFSPAAGRTMVAGLARLLTSEGSLVVGPADHDFCSLQVSSLAQGVYFYGARTAGEAQPVPVPMPSPPAPAPPPTVTPLQSAPAPARAPATERYEELLGQGRDARDAGQAEGALQLFDQTIALIPARPEGYFEQALLLNERRLFEPARAMLERALYLDPCFVPAQVLLARVLGAAGQPGRARALLKDLESSLREAPAAQPVNGWAEMTAGALLKSCQRLLRGDLPGSA